MSIMVDKPFVLGTVLQDHSGRRTKVNRRPKGSAKATQDYGRLIVAVVTPHGYLVDWQEFPQAIRSVVLPQSSLFFRVKSIHKSIVRIRNASIQQMRVLFGK
jgi:hypothetical protein